MPKHNNNAAGAKQHRNSGKPYQRSTGKAARKAAANPQQQLPTLKTAFKHKQTAATLAKTLGCQGINSLLADTAAELQEKGIKQKASSRINKALEQQQQQQQQQQGLVLELQQQSRQQQQSQQQSQQQQQAHAAAHQGPDLMTMLGSWSMQQQPDHDKQQQEQQSLASDGS
jgi:hypothetical protein